MNQAFNSMFDTEMMLWQVVIQPLGINSKFSIVNTLTSVPTFPLGISWNCRQLSLFWRGCIGRRVGHQWAVKQWKYPNYHNNNNIIIIINKHIILSYMAYILLYRDKTVWKYTFNLIAFFIKMSLKVMHMVCM